MTPEPLVPPVASPSKDDGEDTAPSRRTLDNELRILGAMLRLLDELDSRAKARAVAWLYDRYLHDSIPTSMR